MIEINNLTDFTADEKFLKKVAQTVLEGEGKEKHTLSIALIKEKEIRGLNKKYLKKDKPTDVLSFSLLTEFPKEAKVEEGKSNTRLDEAKASSTRAIAKGGKEGLHSLKPPSLSLRESLVGEVIICPQVVKRNAEDFNVHFEKELAKVLIHGILHLLDYEHEKSDKKRKEMQEKENYYLFLCFS